MVAIGLARDNGILDWNLHRFSSTEPSWAFSRKHLGELRGHVTSGQTSMTRQAISQLMRAVMMVMSP